MYLTISEWWIKFSEWGPVGIVVARYLPGNTLPTLIGRNKGSFGRRKINSPVIYSKVIIELINYQIRNRNDQLRGIIS